MKWHAKTSQLIGNSCHCGLKHSQIKITKNQDAVHWVVTAWYLTWGHQDCPHGCYVSSSWAWWTKRYKSTTSFQFTDLLDGLERYVRTWAHACTCTQGLHAQVQKYLCTYLNTHTHMQSIQSPIHTCLHMYVHAYIHRYIRAHTQTCTQKRIGR